MLRIHTLSPYLDPHIRSRSILIWNFTLHPEFLYFLIKNHVLPFLIKIHILVFILNLFTFINLNVLHR
jgi:hypothetical protein